MSSLANYAFQTFAIKGYTDLIAGIVDYSFGISGNMILACLWWKNRHKEIDRFSVLIIAADLMDITPMVLTYIAISLEGFYDNHLGPGIVYCIGIGITTYSNTSTTLFCKTLYAYQRYRVIFRKQPIPLSRCFQFILLYFILCCTIVTAPILCGLPYRYAPAGMYCSVDWKSRALPNILVILFNCTTLGTCTSMLILMYYRIVKRANRTFALSANPQAGDLVMEVNANTDKELSERKKTILKQVIVIISICILCNFPYLLGVLYEVISGNEVSPMFDSITSNLIVANGLFDFIVFVTTNTTYRLLFWTLVTQFKSSV